MAAALEACDERAVRRAGHNAGRYIGISFILDYLIKIVELSLEVLKLEVFLTDT